MKTKYAIVMVHNQNTGKYETGLLIMEGSPEQVFPVLKAHSTYEEALELVREKSNLLGLFNITEENSLLDARSLMEADYIYVYDQKDRPGWYVVIIDDCPQKHAIDQEFEDLMLTMKNRGKYLIEFTMDEVSPSSSEKITQEVYERKEKYLNTIKVAFEKIGYSMEYVYDQFPYVHRLSCIDENCSQREYYNAVMSEQGIVTKELCKHLDIANSYTIVMPKTSMQQILHTHKLMRSACKDYCNGLDMTFSMGDKSVSELVEIAPNTKEVIVLPAGINSIGPGALSGCMNVKRIVLPDTISPLELNEVNLIERLKEAPTLKEVGFPEKLIKTEHEWSEKVILALHNHGYVIGSIGEKTYQLHTSLNPIQEKYLAKSRAEGYRGAALDRL